MSSDAGYFFQLLPWCFITKFHPGVVIQKDGILQRTFAYRAPDIDSAGADEIITLAVRVDDFARRLGAGWAFHLEAQRFELQEYPAADFDALAPYLVDGERRFNFNSSGRHFDSSYFLTFTYKPPSESVKKLTRMFIQSAGDSADGHSVKQNVDFFVSESDSAARLLSDNLLLVPLDNEETVAYLHSTVSLKKHWLRFPFTRIMLDRILPDMELDNTIPMRLGGFYIPIVGINDFPEESYPAILDGLNRAKIPYRWVTRYICAGKEEGKKEALKKEKAHRGSRKTLLQTFAESTAGGSSQTVNHGAGVKEGDAILAGSEIETDEAALGYLTTCVMVWDADLDRARAKADAVAGIVNSKGFSCKEEKYNALEAFKGMMPGQVFANYRSLPVMSYTMSHVVPLSSVWSGQRHNAHAQNVTGVGIPHCLCSTVEGTPFYLNINVGDVGHASVFGPTGGGKSTVLGLLIMQFFKYPGSHVVVFDKGRSCRQACMACGGFFYEPASENAGGVSFQPLRDLETETDLLYACDFVEACVTANGEAVPPAMSAAVREALEKMAGIPKNRRTITSFLMYCGYQDRAAGRNTVKEIMSVYAYGGKYGKIFDDDASEISVDSRFTAFEMESLMERGENCVVPALVYLFNTVEKKFDGRLTMLVLDEAWLFLKNEIFAGKIAEWLKVLRKKNVFVVFATQDVADVANSPLKTTITQQCLTKIFLADPSALIPNMRDVYSGFGLAPPEISLIASATMKRDYFYTSPAGRRLFQLSLDRLTLALIGAPDHALLDSLASKYEPGSFLCAEILAAKGVDYRALMRNHWKTAPEDAPADPLPQPRKTPPHDPKPQAETPRGETAAAAEAPGEPPAGARNGFDIAAFLDAVSSLPDRKRNGGQGRAAGEIAAKYRVSPATVYMARKIIKNGNIELVDALRSGALPVKTAYKRLKTEGGEHIEPEQAAG